MIEGVQLVMNELEIALLIPFTYVRFRVRRKVREVCIDSFTIANVSKPFRVAFTVYPYGNVRKYEAGPWGSAHRGASILLRREIPSWEALGRVISIYRSIKSELLSKAREAHLAHFVDVVVSGIITPQLKRRQERLGTELGELITAASFFESVLGNEVVKEDPLVEDVRETALTVPAGFRDNRLVIDTSTPLGRIYSWLLRIDSKFSDEITKEIRAKL